MKMFNRIAIGAALLAPMVAAPASAQSWKWDLGLGAGYTMFTTSVDDEGLGAFSALEGLKFDNGIRPNVRLGVWFTPRIGLRANATYQDGKVESDDGTEIAENINMWSGTGDLLFRFATPNDTWMGSEFLPYLALGLGGKWINPATDDQNCTGGEEDFSCAYMGGTGTALGEKSQLSGLVGLGADWRLSPRFAINLELNDRMYKPPFYGAAVPTVPGTVAIASDDRVSKLTHEFGADVGLKFLFGLQPPPVVVVLPTPAPPPPPPPPPPAPPVAPREEAITVCVIDPTAPNGIRMQSATFLPASGDTMVMVNGNRVAIGTTVGNVMVARNADWYVRGEPLTINVGNQKMQYMTYQGATQIDADRLSYLGTVNGYPVYANRDEVADINQALADLRAAQAGRDLGEILAQRKDLRDELDDVSLLYVPLAPTGCVFQTVQMMQQVRKGK